MICLFMSDFCADRCVCGIGTFERREIQVVSRRVNFGTPSRSIANIHSVEAFSSDQNVSEAFPPSLDVHRTGCGEAASIRESGIITIQNKLSVYSPLRRSWDRLMCCCCRRKPFSHLTRKPSETCNLPFPFFSREGLIEVSLLERLFLRLDFGVEALKHFCFAAFRVLSIHCVDGSGRNWMEQDGSVLLIGCSGANYGWSWNLRKSNHFGCHRTKEPTQP